MAKIRVNPFGSTTVTVRGKSGHRVKQTQSQRRRPPRPSSPPFDGRITATLSTAIDADILTVSAIVTATRAGRKTGSETGDTVTLHNEDGWLSDAGASVKAEWDNEYNDGEGRWLIYLAPCPAPDAVS